MSRALLRQKHEIRISNSDRNSNIEHRKIRRRWLRSLEFRDSDFEIFSDFEILLDLRILPLMEISLMQRILVICLSAGAVLTASQARADIQVCAAVRSITPAKMLPVSGGMGRPKPATAKKGELTARAIVLRKGETSVAIVALDLLGFPSVLADRVRAKVQRIPAKNILVASTHTHSAPDCYGFPDGSGGHTGDLDYMQFVCDRAAEAINAAIDHLQPAALKIATGEAKGKIAYNYYAPDLYDRRMSVIQAIGPQGKTIATLVNYAIHPEVLGNSVGIISPDLVGPLCEKLESQTGGLAIFVNGAEGGMITADNRNLNQPRDPLCATGTIPERGRNACVSAT